MLAFRVIVYGDPQFETAAGELLEKLRENTFGIGDDLDELRSLLIQAGQLEQAIEDSPSHMADAAAARKITDAAAAAFYIGLTQCSPELPATDLRLYAAVNQLKEILRDIPAFSDASIHVKIPEGFQFYALFPEQYCHAAQAWSHNFSSDHDRTVLVIGIRSIGTTLSALVATTLAAAGWRPMRITVRPSGHPFSRMVELPGNVRRLAHRALVVDEGPGISGSSMAAVAEALSQGGFAPEEISFFPGHAKEPGQAASAGVRKWWRRIRRYVTTLEQVHWNGLTLVESLQNKACELAGCSQAPASIADLSCGRWREKIYRTLSEWPWAAIPFEQMKYHCSVGEDRAILWKFTGLEKSAMQHFLSKPSANEDEVWSPKPLAWFRGFVAIPWIEGEPLSMADNRNPEILRHIGRYIASVCKAPLSSSEQNASARRIQEMLVWNTKLALGETLAERALRFAESIPALDPCPAYGDGRLAPQEWVRTSKGQIRKLDALGHDADHTIVGRQPVYWDVAGAMAEWRLHSSQRLLSALNEHGIVPNQQALAFYQMAYAAFRLGQASLCADVHAGDAIEYARLLSAVGQYRGHLYELLERVGR